MTWQEVNGRANAEGAKIIMHIFLNFMVKYNFKEKKIQRTL